MNRGKHLLPRLLLGAFGLLLTGIGLWIGQSVAGGASGPFGAYAALLAVVLGGLVVYIASDPEEVR